MMNVQLATGIHTRTTVFVKSGQCSESIVGKDPASDLAKVKQF